MAGDLDDGDCPRGDSEYGDGMPSYIRWVILSNSDSGLVIVNNIVLKGPPEW